MDYKEKVVEVIFQSIDEINTQNDLSIKKDINTKIFGSDSELDSLGLINLIVAVEQNIEDEFNVHITLADERAMSPEHSPFKNVDSMADYINILLGEKLND